MLLNDGFFGLKIEIPVRYLVTILPSLMLPFRGIFQIFHATVGVLNITVIHMEGECSLLSSFAAALVGVRRHCPNIPEEPVLTKELLGGGQQKL